MVNFFSSIENTVSEESKYYMVEKLKRRLSVIYNYYLIKNYSEYNNKLLMSFDSFIKERSSYVFQLLVQDKDRFGHENIVASWRNSSYKNSFYLWLKQIKFKVLLLSGKKNRNLTMPKYLKRK